MPLVTPIIYITRHGETTWNMVGRYQGRLESALSALGLRQGEALAQRFANEPPDRIISSPLLRCAATARFVAARTNREIETDAALVEIDHGTWEGRYRDELAKNDPERFRAWREQPDAVSFEGGESVRDVMARWQAFRRALTSAGTTLVVTHDAVVRCALLDLTGRPLADFWEVPFENAALAKVEVDGERWRLLEARETSHLSGLRADVRGQAL